MDAGAAGTRVPLPGRCGFFGLSITGDLPPEKNRI